MGSFPVQCERFARALDNIIQNAVEHTPAGKAVDIIGKHTDEKGMCFKAHTLFASGNTMISKVGKCSEWHFSNIYVFHKLIGSTEFPDGCIDA